MHVHTVGPLHCLPFYLVRGHYLLVGIVRGRVGDAGSFIDFVLFICLYVKWSGGLCRSGGRRDYFSYFVCNGSLTGI